MIMQARGGCHAISLQKSENHSGSPRSDLHLVVHLKSDRHLVIAAIIENQQVARIGNPGIAGREDKGDLHVFEAEQLDGCIADVSSNTVFAIQIG